jgi:hypothetical protein
LPLYEKASAFLAPAAAAVGVIAGLLALRRRAKRHSVLLALTGLALAYFLAIPFFLSQGGNEGARRSVDFSYLGIAILLGPVVVAFVAGWMSRSSRRRLIGGAAVAGVGLVFLMGNVASGFNEAYRFPGPYLYGSDTRTQTAELQGAVDWFRSSQGTNRRMIADRYTGMIFGSRGRQETIAPSRSFPAWDLYFNVAAPRPRLLRQIATSKDTYLVIDERMSRELPFIGIYFNGNEPKAMERVRPVPRAALEKFERLPYTRNIYSSDTLRIYRFRLSAADLRGAVP